MAKRNLVAIGASLGGVEALRQLLGQLPGDLEASLFIVQHTAPSARGGSLDSALVPVTRLPVHYAKDGERFEPGHVYLAPPDRHLLLEAKKLRVVRGPRENAVRPAIDPLFRSAAAHHGSRVVGVVLTGLRDDGAAGLDAIRRSGGATVVQDPEDATFPDMPQSALRLGPADHVLPLTEMGMLIARLATQDAPAGAGAPEDVVREARITASYASQAGVLDQLGRLTQLDCPDCGGPLWEIPKVDGRRFRCRIGHAFSDRALVVRQIEQAERSLLVALRTLEERGRMLHRMSEDARGRDNGAHATRFAQDRDEALAHADVLRDLLGSLG
jgi:two-component system chemotaxis response regulator CheB